MRQIMETMDNNIDRVKSSGKHTRSSTSKDVDELVNRLVQTNAFEENNSRSYAHFTNFERNPFNKLDLSAIYNWINEHKKNIQMGNKAR